MSNSNCIETSTFHNEKYRTRIPMPDKPKHEYDRATGHDVWRWPEFQAFAKRLGIDIEDAPTTNLVITIPIQNVVSVEHTYSGSDMDKK